MARTTKALLAAATLALLAVAFWLLLPSSAERAAGSSDSARISAGGDLIASLRSDPSTYNRYLPAGASAATELLARLVHERLVRVNRATDTIEPGLAESWTQSDDGLTYTLQLREVIRWSDGTPFSAEDVLFSFRMANDESVNSPIRASLQVNGKPIGISARDGKTIVLTFPEPFAPGLRLLDTAPILPRHKLERALQAGTLADEWTPGKPIADVVGLGPFTLAEHVSGQRIVLTRNPHYLRRDAHGVQLPYLDRLTLAIVPDQSLATQPDKHARAQ